MRSKPPHLAWSRGGGASCYRTAPDPGAFLPGWLVARPAPRPDQTRMIGACPATGSPRSRRMSGGTMATASLAGNPTEEECMATASDVAELLATHPEPSKVDREALARCIAECFDCARSCTACADADLAEDDVSEMRRCIRLCLDCADVCDATGRVVSRQTQFGPETSRAQVESCRRSCSACAEECERHAQHHQHCRICADTCRRCEEACASLLASIG
jgi:hypothetical protein